MADALDKLLKGLLGEGDGEKTRDDDDDGDLPSVSDQKAILETILNQDISKHVVGTYVARNKAGKMRYRWPKEGEVAMITHILDQGTAHNQIQDMDFVHGQIAACKMDGGKLKVACSFVDFRYYKVVSHAPKGGSDED